jgi:hypothetical protein
MRVSRRKILYQKGALVRLKRKAKAFSGPLDRWTSWDDGPLLSDRSVAHATRPGPPTATDETVAL